MRIFLHAAPVIAIGIAPGAAPAAAGGPALPSGFSFEHVVQGPFVGEPTGFAFLPDARVLIIERDTGSLRVALAGGADATWIHDVAGSDGTTGERGLLGIAVDPDWPARPYVYLYHSHASHRGHVTRLRASGDLSDPQSAALELGDPYVVFDRGPDFAPWHHGGSVRFGRDGMLYVSLGDNLSRCDAQGFESLAGTLLRVDVSRLPDGAGGPPPLWDITPFDNPVRGPAPLPRLVWARGLRNPFRFTVDPLTGDLFVGDVGEARWEEIDRLPFRGVGGWNLGWPLREGPDPSGLGEECGDGERFTEPVFAYAHESTTSSAVVCGPVYRRPAGAADPPWFPPEYEGNLFLIDHSNGVIRRLAGAGDAWTPAPPAAGQPAPEHWAEGIQPMSDFQQGPDGALWLMKRDSLTWGLWRIARTSITSAPPAATAGMPPLTVRPNPSRPAGNVTVRWSLPHGVATGLRITDVAGRTLRAFSVSPAARGEATWDTRDRRGRPVAPGIYFARLEAAGDPPVARICVR